MEDILQYSLIIAIGIATGFLNTVAGGGSLITLPLLIFIGLPSVNANATSRVAILVQTLFAVRGFRSKGLQLPMPYTIYLCIASIAGGVVGALLAIDIDDKLFNRILAAIMIMVVIIIALDRRSADIRFERLTPTAKIIGTAGFVILGFYGGFIQAGIGFLIIAVLSLVNRFSLVKANFVKVFVILVYTLVVLFVFAAAGKIEWFIGVILAIGQGIGGWYASRWSVDKGDVWIRRILVVTVIGLAIKLWFFG